MVPAGIDRKAGFLAEACHFYKKGEGKQKQNGWFWDEKLGFHAGIVLRKHIPNVNHEKQMVGLFYINSGMF
jgi:hypothetical protein